MTPSPLTATIEPPARPATGLMSGLWVAFLAVALLAGSLVCFAYPRSDECFRAGRVRELGVGPLIVHEYFGWTGRWAGSGLVYVIGATMSLELAYPLLLAGVHAVTFAGVYAALGAALAGGVSPRGRGLLTLGLFALYWSGLPSPGDGFYWLTGIVENQLGVGLSLLVLAAVGRTAAGRAAWPVAALAGVLAVIAVGLHELFGMGLCAALVSAAMLSWSAGSRTWRVWAVVACVACVGLAVVVAAPGNAVRMATIRPNRSFASFCAYVSGCKARTVSWAFDPKLLLATVLVISAPGFSRLRPGWLCDRSMGWRLALVGLGIAAWAGLMLGPWFAAGYSPAGRTLTGLYLVFLLIWFGSVFVVLRPSSAEGTAPAGGPGLALPHATGLLAGYLALSFCVLGNGPVGWHDLRYAVSPYRKAMKRRYQEIRVAKSRGDQDLLVEPLPVVPVCYDHDADLVEPGSAAPNNYVNMHYATYFQVRSLALKPAARAR